MNPGIRGMPKCSVEGCDRESSCSYRGTPLCGEHTMAEFDADVKRVKKERERRIKEWEKSLNRP